MADDVEIGNCQQALPWNRNDFTLPSLIQAANWPTLGLAHWLRLRGFTYRNNASQRMAELP